MSPRSHLETALELARTGQLYPAVILSGGSHKLREEAAVQLAQTLLCEAAASERACGRCRHCRRICWPDTPEAPFHPDFRILLRDRKTTTSAEAVRELVAEWHRHPFEAAGQVFVIGEAESLSAEAGDALLKVLEEPGTANPRHFFLLTPAAGELPATLRSRALQLYFGSPELPEETVCQLRDRFGGLVRRYRAGAGSLYLLGAADVLVQAADFSDARNSQPFQLLAKAVLETGLQVAEDRTLCRALLELAHDLLVEGPHWRLRGAPAERIVLGLVSERLAGLGGLPVGASRQGS